MHILAIDYGRRKIGLAIGDTETKLAEPLSVIRYEKKEDVLTEIREVVEVGEVDKVVMGISEGKMAKEIKEFSKKLEKKIETPIVFQDETLTTHDAQELSIEAGIKRRKRKGMEDAYSAALILQSYLDQM